MVLAKILIVDDEVIIRETLRRALERARYRVETAGSGHRALARLQEEDFHLVISDLKMPGMDGIEVLKTIRRLHPGLPVIIITGYSVEDAAVEAMENGACQYLSKPFTPDQIVAKVQKALGTSLR